MAGSLPDGKYRSSIRYLQLGSGSSLWNASPAIPTRLCKLSAHDEFIALASARENPGAVLGMLGLSPIPTGDGFARGGYRAHFRLLA